MTKKELLKLLENVPDDGLIIVHGHSDGTGYNDVTELKPTLIISGFNGWEGTYLDYDSNKWWADKENKISTTAYRIQ